MSYPLTILPPGDLQLYDNSIPGLLAGDYQIEVTQALPNALTDNFSQLINQEFKVDAPQFSVGASEVHAVFPDERSNGDFSQNLPYIIFETPALPWERKLGSSQPPEIPWMALLLLSSDEIANGPQKSSPLTTSTVQDFLKQDPKIVKPGIPVSSLSPETLDSQMNSILLPQNIFTLVSPRLQELKSLAHVRQVNPSLQVVSGQPDDAWYSELLANRFPVSVNPTDNSGNENFAFAVSLEGLDQYLVDQPAWPQGTDQIQLAVLYSWSFISAEQPGQTFAELAENLAKQAVTPNSENTLLRIPVTDNQSATAKRVQQGYTALKYHTETGDITFTWYRSPLTPFPAQPLPATPSLYTHPSEIMIYDQANAIFDTSYSAAWSIGRLTALSNPVFIDSLQNTRIRIIKQNAKLLQRSLMPHLAGISDLKTLGSAGLTRKVFAQKMIAGMGNELTASFAVKPTAPARVDKPSLVNNLYPDDEMPASPSERAKWFMQKQEISSFLLEDSAELTDVLADWLTQLILLQNIPFSNLVPDQRMLPQESIRFFNIDPAWLKALFDGALSIAINSSQSEIITAIIAPHVWNQTLIKAAGERRKLLREPIHENEPLPGLPAAGMLLRSALVSGWPGLQVQASIAGTPVNIRRIDHLSPTVLFVLWDKVPDTVYVRQPQQGFTYGSADGWKIPLRSLNPANLGATTGPSFPLTGDLTQYMRHDSNAKNSLVLNLAPLVSTQKGYLIPDLTTALVANSQLTPSQLAIELIRSPEAIKFNPIVH